MILLTLRFGTFLQDLLHDIPDGVVCALIQMQAIKGSNEGNSWSFVVGIVLAQQKSEEDQISCLNVGIGICQKESETALKIHRTSHRAKDVFQVSSQ